MKQSLLLHVRSGHRLRVRLKGGDSHYRTLCYCTTADIAPLGAMTRLCTRVRRVTGVSDMCTVLPATTLNLTMKIDVLLQLEPLLAEYRRVGSN